MASEKIFENKIKKHLEERGCYYVKFFANSYTKIGVPDILASVNGRFVAIEVKAKNGRPSELQKLNRKQIRDSGGISIILYPSQFEDFKLLIDDLLNNRNFSVIYEEQKNFDKK